jgi:predicted transcriptional regulator
LCSDKIMSDLLENGQLTVEEMSNNKTIMVNLTSKGKNRLKRTTKLIREKWKRELSSITCSWIAKRNCYDFE